VNRAQVGVLKQTDQVRLARLLKKRGGKQILNKQIDKLNIIMTGFVT
jgi:hypothetical protein